MTTPTAPALDPAIRDLAQRALEVSRTLATVSTEQKDRWLLRLADALTAEQDALLAANARDLDNARAEGLSSAMIDRLRLTPERLAKIAVGVREVARLPDPVGEVLSTYQHPKGFSLKKVRVPIGVIGIIYESRPNVTVDCAILCLKSGNATILRGGKEAFHSNQALTKIIRDCLVATGLPADAVQLLPTTDRAALQTLLKLDQYIHCLIPRGGEGLIRYVAENATMPVIKHYKGVCNIFIDAEAVPAMAEAVVINAKVQRPGVCNAVENLIVHQDYLETHFVALARALVAQKVELRVDAPAAAVLKTAGLPYNLATEEDYFTEYLDLILSVKTVPDLESAIAFINHYGSAHSDAIVTENRESAQRFLNSIDAAAVYWNVSTRFTDGYEFGLGAEIGISTDKLHARGPMGLAELTSYKFVAEGHGEIR